MLERNGNPPEVIKRVWTGEWFLSNQDASHRFAACLRQDPAFRFEALYAKRLRLDVSSVAAVEKTAFGVRVPAETYRSIVDELQQLSKDFKPLLAPYGVANRIGLVDEWAVLWFPRDHPISKGAYQAVREHLQRHPEHGCDISLALERARDYQNSTT